MKNIHILPTDNKYSRLYFNVNDKEFQICEVEKTSTILKPNQNIYITSDEVKKHNEWVLSNLNEVVKFCSLYCQNLYKKIILTTDQDLIKDGVQAIDDEFLEWFVKNPSCEEVEVTYGVLKPFQSEDIGYLIHCPDNEVLEEPKQEYEYIGECKGNDGNGCFMDNPAHNCGCFVRKPKQETILEDKLKLLVEEWRERQINYETSANNFIEDHSNNRKFTYKAMATRDCWKELLKLIEDGK